MTDTTQGALTLDDGIICFETAGQGETLVMSHAGFLDSHMFDAQWDILAQHFHLIRYDMRGFGQSGTVSGPVCRRDDLRRLLDHLNVTQAHFIGCSIGGEIVLDLALENPDLVSSLTVVCGTPGGFELQGEPPRHLFEMFDAIQQGDIDRASELQIRIWFDGGFREPDQVDPVLRDQALAMNRPSVERRTFLIADTQPANPLDPPAVTRLPEIACPLLIVAGALDHPEILRAADLMAAQVPNSHKVIMEGCGHVPSFEQPAEFTRLFLDFLHR